MSISMAKMAKIATMLLISFVVTGCISYQSDTAHGHHEFSQVHEGETTTGWLLDHYGSPNSVNETSAGTEIWHYEMEESEDTDVSLFIVFDFSSTTRRTRNFFFEVHGGIVKKAWQSES